MPVSEHKQPCGYLWADDMRRLRMVGKLGDDERGGDGDGIGEVATREAEVARRWR